MAGCEGGRLDSQHRHPRTLPNRREARIDDGRDRRLLGLAMQNDGEALNELMELHWAPLVDYVARLSAGNRDLAKDVAQEVFLRVWERRVTWHPTGSVRAFLFGIGRNLCLNQRKWSAVRARAAGRVRELIQGLQRTPSPLELTEESESLARAERAVARLPERRREVFLLVRVQGFSYQEVAETLGVSPQTVANHMSAALSQLRQLL